MKVSVKVPASSANIGPGFDCLGLALPIYNTITIEETVCSTLTAQYRDFRVVKNRITQHKNAHTTLEKGVGYERFK